MIIVYGLYYLMDVVEQFVGQVFGQQQWFVMGQQWFGGQCVQVQLYCCEFVFGDIVQFVCQLKLFGIVGVIGQQCMCGEQVCVDLGQCIMCLFGVVCVVCGQCGECLEIGVDCYNQQWVVEIIVVQYCIQVDVEQQCGGEYWVWWLMFGQVCYQDYQQYWYGFYVWF